MAGVELTADRRQFTAHFRCQGGQLLLRCACLGEFSLSPAAGVLLGLEAAGVVLKSQACLDERLARMLQVAAQGRYLVLPRRRCDAG